MCLRLQALEVAIEADLRLGRPTDVIIELRQLAAAYPLRERLHALLMTGMQSMAGWSAPRQLPATVPHFAGRVRTVT